ncbi:hypothetical protein NF867_14140 [Solitalea sp. MAHUQ-68]|uniref:Uncharacterized protein n=1 Tax=Solitalea agri TaxID=2953739 RepID=A0A9X2F3D4_9SPHI|nr:hypothetical protein [Solitalea agri]MCO4294002.1 hypothetical protein [Solitalea agri]
MDTNDFENSIPKPEQPSPFTVPENYFNSLSNRIWAKIELEDSGLNIERVTNKHPFKLPDNYFNSLSDRIQNRLKSEESEDSEFSIPGLTKKNPFTTPDNYFEELSSIIEEQVFSDIADIELKNAHQTFINRFYRMAIAACFTALAGWFGYTVYQTSKLDKQINSTANVVKIDNQNFDLNYFDESMVVDEVMNAKSINTNYKQQDPEKTGKLENYILNNVDEELLLQEL